MRIDAEHQSLIITEDELAAVAAELKLPRNKLTLINAQFGMKSGERAMKDFDGLPGWARDVYRQSIIGIASPAQTARINIAFPNRTVSQLALAWDRNDVNIITVVSRMGGEMALKQVTAAQAQDLIGRPLEIDKVKSAAGVNLTIPAVALITWLAVIDYAQYDWYVSMLKHSEPADSFTLDEIWERLQDAAGGDYRWPLPFFFSVFPVDVSGRLSEKELSTSLGYLSRMGLLTGDDGSVDGDSVYTLSTEGSAIAGSFISGGTRLAMTISAPAGGETGYEILMFVRGSDDLWLFDLSGNKGAVAGLGPGSFNSVINTLFMQGEQMQQAGTPSCSYCGKKTQPGDEFCPECGKPLKTK